MSQSKSFSKVFLLSILCLLIVMLFSTAARSAPVVAQSDPQPADEGIFTAVAAPAGLTQADLGPEVLRSRYVTIDFDAFGLTTHTAADALQVNPFAGVSWTAVQEAIQQSHQSESLIWNGHLAGIANSQATFVINGDVLIGKLAMLGGIYEIGYTGIENIHVVKEINQAALIDHASEIPALPDELNDYSPDSLVPVPDALAADDGSIIDVLVVYSPEARAGAGGTAAIEATIELAVAETNVAYENSDVNQRLVLVHMYESPDAELADMCGSNQDTCPDGDLIRLATPGDGYIDNVHSLRNEYHADFVTLIKENDNGCGLGYLQTSAANSLFENGAFNVTARGCATGNYTFGHELGHNMGLRHDWFVDDSTTPFSFAHGFTNRTDGWRTVMAYNDACDCLDEVTPCPVYDSRSTKGSPACTRLSHFSNDEITYLGDAMGIAGGTSSSCVETNYTPNPESCDADNESVLNSNALSNSRFRSSQITWLGNNNNWNDANNWEILEGPVNRTSGASSTPVNRVPRSIDDVYIPSSPTGGNFPTITGSFEIRNMLLETGASLTISSGTLTVYGDWEEQGTGTTTANGGTILFAGSLPQTIKTSANSQFNHLQIGNGGSTAVTLNSDLDVNGDITIQISAQLSAESYLITVGGNWDDIGSGFEANAGTVHLNGNNQTIDKAPSKIIFSEDFNTYTTCGCTTDAPIGWGREQSAGFGFLFGKLNSAPNGAAALWDDSTEGWLFTPGIELEPGIDYEIQFKHADYFGNGSFTIDVYHGAAQTSGAMNTLIGTATDPSGTAYQSNTFAFTVSTAGTYHLGFNGQKTATYGLLDDIVVTSSQEQIFYNLQISSTGSASLNQSTSVQNNLTTNNGGTLNINGQTLTVEGAVTNNGTLRDTKTVSGDTSFAMIQNTAADTTKYYGLDINNVGGNMGSTTVDISGGQDCGLGAGSYINRCYDITPTTPQSADITFWFSEADRDSENASTSTAWHWNGASWDPASSTATYNQSEAGASCTLNGGLGCWVKAVAVTTYSPFAIGGDNTAAEIAVTAAGTNITNGGSFDFGSTLIGTPISQSFTISNTGTSTLTLANLTVPAGFAIESSFGLTDVPTDTATTFVISLTATAVDSYSGTLSFDNNDPDEDPFAFTIRGDVLAEPEPEITVTAAGTNITDGGSFALGATTIGTPISQSFTISNSGTTSLTLANLTIPAGFTVTQSFSATVGAGLTTTLGLQLEATAVGSYSGDLSFDTNDSDENPFNFTLSGEVLGIPEIEVTVDANPVADGGSVDFGPTLLGEPITQTFTISNTGSATLTLANLTVPAGFAIAADFGVTDVPTDTSTTFVISLTATATGNYSGTLSFDTNDPDENPFDIVVEGTVTAPDMVVIIDSAAITNGSGFVDFGSAVVGNPITKEVTIQNNGTAALIVSDFSVPNGFSLTAPLSATIPVSSETAITLTLEAAVAGIYSGTVSFTTNDAAENPFAFTVEGTVTDTPEAEIQVLDGATNIVSGVGTVDLGTTPFATPVMRVLTVRNAGTAALSLGSLTVPDGYTAVFSNTLVAPSDSTLLTVTLTAEAAGTFSGTLSFVTNDTNENPFSFAVTGVVDNPPDPEITLFNGTQLLIDGVSEVDFGTVLLGEVVTKTFTVENNGLGDLLLSDLAVTGSGFIIASDFATTTVASGDATTFTIELDTAVVGEFTATVSFANNDANENPFSFTVVGIVFEEEAPAGVYLPVIIGN